MADKNRLLEIKELNFTGKDDDQFEGYLTELFFYCDTLPSHKACISATLEAKDYGTLMDFLKTAREFLANIQADGLSSACSALVDELAAVMKGDRTLDREQIEADTNALLASMDTLSIDILVAGYIKEYSPPEGYDDSLESWSYDLTPTIMAVDDSGFYLNILKRHMQDMPYKLDCVNSGGEAVKIIMGPGKKAPNLFIIDIEMPIMNGYELARAIRKAGLKSPIIFLTSMATTDTVLQALQAGGTDLIIKSCSRDQVLERIQKYM
ncbi:MAG: response regulator [Oscillospiraceae bacterium]|nr:response regulator [Oscillospiraceae bacterium]